MNELNRFDCGCIYEYDPPSQQEKIKKVSYCAPHGTIQELERIEDKLDSIRHAVKMLALVMAEHWNSPYVKEISEIQ